jgi:hypothetical protein
MDALITRTAGTLCVLFGVLAVTDGGTWWMPSLVALVVAFRDDC